MQEFEPILLKKLIYSSEYFNKVIPIIEDKHFSGIGNQKLFSLIKDYYSDYREIPSLTELVAKVKNVSNAEIRSEIINSLQEINKTDEVENLEFMCDETLSWVKDQMYMEALRIGSDGLMKRDDSLKLKAQQIMDARAKLVIDSDLGLEFDNINEMIAYYSERNIGIKTQHKELNKRLGPGFLPKTLSVILAGQGIGKSLMMTDIVSGLIKNNKNILLVSLEMADKEIMKRVHANVMDLPINSLIDLSKTEAELKELDRPILDKEQILSAYNKIKMSGTCGKFFVKDYPAGSFSPLMLENLIESFRLEKNIDLDIVFVDYLGIMKSDLVSPSAGLYSYIKSIGEEVRAVAKKQNLSIISASQLNRGSVNNVDSTDNSNISDSIGTAMTADFMLFLLQDEAMKERKEIVCKVTKNRFNGRTDTWLMGIEYEKMRFYDLVVQDGSKDINIIEELGIDSSGLAKVDDDFGIVTTEKQKQAEEFAHKEVKDIIKSDHQKIIEQDKKLKSDDPFNNTIEDLYKELGL